MDLQANREPAQRYCTSRKPRRGSWGIDPLDFPECPWGNSSLVQTDQGTQLWAAHWAAEKQQIESMLAISPLSNSSSTVHRPLQNHRTIRLLKILGFSPASSELRCTLEHHSLESAPSFDAISYTWGSPIYGGHENDERTEWPRLYFRQVNCDGILCIITENLFDGLCQLAISNTSEHLWADALCIDQTNLEEKASQILIMGDIYARASRVIVWLGNYSSDVYNFARTRETLVSALKKYEAENGPNSIAVHNPLDSKFLHAIGIQSPDEWRESWAKYFLFFQRRRWFRRAWVIQEIALAGEILFFCGDQQLLSRDIYELGLMIRDNGWRHALAEVVGSNPRGGIGDEADRLLEYRDQVRCGGPQDPGLQDLFRRINGATSPEQFWISYLQYMIQEIRRFQATDERDQIYAVLGLAKRFLAPGMTDLLRPDYSLTCEQLYISVTQIFIGELPLLSSLSYVGSSSGRLDLPTWVPDYSCALGRVPFIHIGNSDIFDASCAKMNRREQPRFDRLGRHLVLNGAVFDTIVEVCPTIKALRETCMVIPYFNICLNLSNNYQSTHQDRVEVLWRTLIADTSERAPKLHPAPPEYSRHFHDWILTQMTAYLSQSKIRFSQKNSQFPKLSKLAESNPIACPLPATEEIVENIGSEMIRVLETNDSYRKGINPLNMPCSHLSTGFYIFDRAVKETRASRRMFRTRDGHLGLGPASMETGDDIWLLQGSRVPFILRGHSDGYQLQGEAYLHGFMHGEMMSSNLKDRIAPVTII